jgi:hypothetical protein
MFATDFPFHRASLDHQNHRPDTLLREIERFAVVASVALLCLTARPAVSATAPEPQLQRLALCQDSWFDFKDDAARMSRFTELLETRYTPGDEGAFTPKLPTSALGLPVAQVFPQSVGMGVGFSLLVDADFAQTRSAIEKALGRTMNCTTSEGVRSCDVALGAKKTAVLMNGDNGRAKTSLLGCYYFYQQ